MNISDIQFSDFSPFVHLWIVFFNSVTEIFRPAIKIIYFPSILKPKLTNISYKDMQNLNSPSDCIQFPVSDNERMMMSCIIHISDSRKSTVNWSWGVETQTGFEYIIITKYIVMHYLSYNLITSILQLCKFFHLAMQLRNGFVLLESLQFQSTPVHRLITDISFYYQ